ncbi:hypothetical protein DYB37_009619 [Aphanomyces astaci]|uniref:Uncharacterized protein n=1 Tax=Aphanomyces astaci TaxID=112090 RepID=A0A3R6WUN9_APHAT|nr:hypothetical protein DYB35_009740 [Aphanomyces astaci]RHZ13663.1 hypothetical protein DYB37_009619 [Aphanomyces astaci]
MVDFLCNAGANVNLQDKKGGNTTIMLTLAQQPPQYLAILEILLKHQPDLTLKDSTGQTAVHLAAQYECVDGVKLLLASKSNLDIPDAKNMTPLLVAVGKRNVGIVDLLGAKASVNVLGNSPLHAEALRSDATAAWPTDVAQVLLTSFPEIATLKNAKGKTADQLVGGVEETVTPAPSSAKAKTPAGGGRGRKQHVSNDDDGPSAIAIQNAKAAMMARVKERAQKRRSLIPEEDTDLVEPIKPQDALSPPVANTTSSWTMALIVAVVIAFFAAVYAMLEASAAK